MNGFIKEVVGAGLLTAVALLGGCCGYDRLVDPCWPQRYNGIAREEVREPLGTQAANGLYLEQTLWNHHFEDKEATLTPGAKHLLARLSRRRPEPYKEIFVQTSYDYEYDPSKSPAENAQARAELDVQRTQAVQKYLEYSRPDLAFRVGIHDPSEVGMAGFEAARVVRNALEAPARGQLQTEREQSEREISDASVNQDIERRSTDTVDLDFERKDTPAPSE